ncbi:hypothetical protein EE612_001200 [Oryza sativa]|nr:hypothetical protein EE612_001200 [Oryza sativa]
MIPRIGYGQDEHLRSDHPMTHRLPRPEQPVPGSSVGVGVQNGVHKQLHKQSSSPSRYHCTPVLAVDPLKHHNYHHLMLASLKALPNQPSCHPSVIGSISQDGGQLLAQEALLRKKRHLISQLAGQKTHTLVQEHTQMCPLLWLKHECYYQKSILQVRNLPPRTFASNLASRRIFADFMSRDMGVRSQSS